MKFNLLIFTVLAAASPLAEPNNKPGEGCCDVKCYERLEYANSHDMGNASRDCKSYQRTTITPCPTTKTVFTTATVTVTKTGGVEPRAIERRHDSLMCTPTSKSNVQPGYANDYCNGDDWAKACSCLGVNPTTVTAPQATITTTKCGGTVTVTKTVTTSKTTKTTSKSTLKTTPSTTSSTTSSTTPKTTSSTTPTTTPKTTPTTTVSSTPSTTPTSTPKTTPTTTSSTTPTTTPTTTPSTTSSTTTSAAAVPVCTLVTQAFRVKLTDGASNVAYFYSGTGDPSQVYAKTQQATDYSAPGGILTDSVHSDMPLYARNSDQTKAVLEDDFTASDYGDSRVTVVFNGDCSLSFFNGGVAVNLRVLDTTTEVSFTTGTVTAPYTAFNAMAVPAS